MNQVKLKKTLLSVMGAVLILGSGITTTAFAFNSDAIKEGVVMTAPQVSENQQVSSSKADVKISEDQAIAIAEKAMKEKFGDSFNANLKLFYTLNAKSSEPNEKDFRPTYGVFWASHDPFSKVIPSDNEPKELFVAYVDANTGELLGLAQKSFK